MWVGRSVSCLAALVALAAAPAARADTTQSTNWAGYAVHGSGVSYGYVQGSWVQPGASCRRGRRTFSSYWVGIGGFSERSQALEQVGTEVDCTRFGKVKSTAWYELVPAPSTPVRLKVHPGDLIQASVSVKKKRVTVVLYDATRKRGFHKTVRAKHLDVSSAEWIVEAPSACLTANLCDMLPLANFGSVTFDSAWARSTRLGAGAISSPVWQATKINLRPQGGRFVADSRAAQVLGVATTSGLEPSGTGFSVTYSREPLITVILSGRNAAVRAGHIVHPSR